MFGLFFCLFDLKAMYSTDFTWEKLSVVFWVNCSLVCFFPLLFVMKSFIYRADTCISSSYLSFCHSCICGFIF